MILIGFLIRAYQLIRQITVQTTVGLRFFATQKKLTQPTVLQYNLLIIKVLCLNLMVVAPVWKR